MRPMVRILYCREEYMVTVAGHAEYAEAGKDIVCAAVSALSEAMLQRTAGRKIWQPAWGVNREHDRNVVHVRLTPKGKIAAIKAREMLDTICAGYRSIAREYPDHVSFREV